MRVYQARANLKELSRKLVKLVKQSGGDMKNSESVIFMPELITKEQAEQVQSKINSNCPQCLVSFVTNKSISENFEKMAGLEMYSLLTDEDASDTLFGEFADSQTIFKKVMSETR